MLAFGLVTWLLCGPLAGYGTLRTLAPGLGRLRALALSPIVALATTSAFAAWSELLSGGVALSVTSAVQVALGLIGVGWAVRDARDSAHSLLRPDRWQFWAVVASGLTALILLALGLNGDPTYTPNDDGIRHATILSLLLETRTLDASALTPSDLLSGAGSEVFYPTGLHTSAALLVHLTNVAPSTALMIVALGGTSALPIGSALLTHRLVGDAAAASFSALVALTAPALSIGVLSWGGLPLLVATCASPAILEAFLALRVNLRKGFALALASLGVFVTQTGQWIVLIGVASVVALLGIGMSAVRSVAPLPRARALIFLLVAPLLATPLLPDVVVQGQARATEEGFSRPSTIPALGELLAGLAFPAPAAAGYLLICALVGATICVRRRRGMLAVALAAATVVLPIAMGLPGPVGDLAALPFYRAPVRVAPMATLWLPTLAGVALAAGWAVLRDFSSRARNTRVAPAALSGAALAAVLLTGAASTMNAVGNTAESVAFVSADDRAASAWLASNVPDGERVLNDRDDMTRWAFVEDRVPTVHGIKPAYGWVGADWAKQTEALELLPRGVTPRLGELLKDLRVEYVVTSERSLDDGRSFITPDELRGVCGLDEVFTSGDVAVFRLNGSACRE